MSKKNDSKKNIYILKLLSKLFFYLIYTVSFVLLLIYLFFYLPYFKKVKNLKIITSLQDNTDISLSTISQVGPIKTEKKSSFTHFPYEKKSGYIRIGAFGDSYTYGDEVDDASDFPYLLQEIFQNAGYHNVEVLNFGHSGWGGHQAFRLWELEGKKYDLDYVLLGPEGMQITRDLTFNPWPGLVNNTDYIRGRYIINNNSVKFITPYYQFDIDKSFNAYFGFFPKWNYLRYDTKPPIIIRSLLPENKTIENPFYYYRGRQKEEYQKIYSLLFQKLSIENMQTIYLKNERHLLTPNFPKNLENFYSENINMDYTDFFKTPNQHNGPLQNYNIAKQFFDILTKQKQHKIEYLKIEDALSNIQQTTATGSSNILLQDLANITFDINEANIGVLLSNLKTSEASSDFDSYKNHSFFINNIKSILCLKDKNVLLANSLFLPLPFSISKNSFLQLRYKIDGQWISKKLAKPTFITNNVSFIELDEIIHDKNLNNFKELIYDGLIMDINKFNIDKTATDFSIWSNENKIYDLTKGKYRGREIMKLKPSNLEHMVFRFRLSYPSHIDDYAESGQTYLSLIDKNGKKHRTLIGSWEKKRMIKDIDTTKIKNWIVKPE